MKNVNFLGGIFQLFVTERILWWNTPRQGKVLRPLTSVNCQRWRSGEQHGSLSGCGLCIWSPLLLPPHPTWPSTLLSVLSLLSKKRSNKHWEVINRQLPPSCQSMCKDLLVVVCEGAARASGVGQSCPNWKRGRLWEEVNHTLAAGCPPRSQLGWIFPFFIAKADPSLGSPRDIWHWWKKQGEPTTVPGGQLQVRVRPHYQQVTRTPAMWSWEPKWKCYSFSRVRLFVTPWTEAHQLQNTGEESHSLLQGIFPT